MAISGKNSVAATLALAERRMRRHRPDVDPVIGEPMKIGDDKIRPGEWLPDAFGMPPGCPVQVLGMDGDILYFVDAMGQLAACEPSALGLKYIQRLFGDRQRYLYWAWPRFSDKNGIQGWRAERAAECFYTCAGRKELFSPLDHVRGRGAWANDRGVLVFHSGDYLWRTDERDRKGDYRPIEAGLSDGILYPRRPPILAPWPRKVTAEDNPARSLLQGLKSWRWARPDVDPVLMLGWIGAALLGGALPHRPTVFLVGDKQTGKSNLQRNLKSLFGDMLTACDDTTAAGVYSAVKQDSVPVSVDELEAEADNRKTKAVVNLARITYSGGKLRRGSQDQTANEFTLRSCFIFSAINSPPLNPQDVSRMAVLRLEKFDREKSGDKAPTIDREITGLMLLRVMMDGWERFPAAFDAYRDALRAGGHDGRGQDTFATLLACADLMLGPELLEEFNLPVEDLSPWSRLLATSAMFEYDDQAENWRACLNFLLTARVETWRAGAQHTVGAIFEHLAELHRTLNCDSEGWAEEVKKHRSLLAQADLGLMLPGEFDDGFTLAIPNESQLVAALLRDSVWAGAPGASVWKSALRQAPKDVVSFDPMFNRVRINGVQRRCTLVRLRKLEEV